MIADYRIFDGTRFIFDLAGICLFLTINNLFCITCYGYIRIMRYNNYLPFLFRSAYTRYKFAINRLVVKVILWLIDNYWLTFLAKCKIENQQNNTTLTRREFFQGAPTHF